MPDVGRLLHQFTVVEYAVARHVAAHVDVRAKRWQRRVARRADGKHRAGLGIELAEAQEIRGLRLRQDHHVALHAAAGEARGVAGDLATPDALANFLGIHALLILTSAARTTPATGFSRIHASRPGNATAS